MADLAAGPEGEALPGVEEGAGLVVSYCDRHLGAIPRMQRFLATPAELCRENPAAACVAQGAGPDHQACVRFTYCADGCRVAGPGRAESSMISALNLN